MDFITQAIQISVSANGQIETYDNSQIYGTSDNFNGPIDIPLGIQNIDIIELDLSDAENTDLNKHLLPVQTEPTGLDQLDLDYLLTTVSGNFNPESFMDTVNIFNDQYDNEVEMTIINNTTSQENDIDIELAISKELGFQLEGLSNESSMSVDEIERLVFSDNTIINLTDTSATLHEEDVTECSSYSQTTINTKGGRGPRGPYKKRFREPKSFSCPHCTIISKTNYALNLHITTVHKKEKNHTCTTCHKSFGRISHLKSHEATHFNVEKTFKCNICHSMLKSAASLSIHQNQHKDPKFNCNKCDKWFHFNYQLKEHLNTHSDTLNHQCKVCDKKYVSFAILKMHLRSHVTKKLQCACCFKEVKSAQTLKTHLMKNHSHIDEVEFRNLVTAVNNLIFDYDILQYVPKSKF